MAVERIEPDTQEWDAWYAGHVVRYMFATEHLGDAENVLDAACGVGYGSAYIAEHTKANVVGIDRSPYAVSVARKRFSHPRALYINDDCHTLKMAQHHAPFGAVVSFETLEHLPHPRQFLKRCYELLLTDGVLIISTPNVLVTGNRKWEFHEREYTPEEFVTMLQEEGFQDVELYGQQLTLAGKVRYYSRAIFNKVRHYSLLRLLAVRQGTLSTISHPVPTRIQDYVMKPTTLELCKQLGRKGPRFVLAVVRK